MRMPELKTATAAFVIATALLLANAGISLWSTNHLVEADRSVTRTQYVLEMLDAVRSAVAEAESGQRGYLLTGRQSYLDTYQSAAERARDQLEKLRDLTEDNIEQQGHLSRLQRLVTSRLERLQRNITRRQEEGPEAARQIVGTDAGQQLMDRIRETTDAMHGVEVKLLRERKRGASRSQQIKTTTTLVGTLIGVAALSLAYYFFRRRLAERRGAELNARSRARRLSAISEFRQRALSEDIGPLQERAVRVIAEVLDVPLAKVLELLPDGSGFLLQAGVGWQQGAVGRAVVGAGLDSQAGYTLYASQPVVIGDLTTHVPVIVDDLRRESRFSGPPLLLDHGVVSGMSVIIYDQPARPYGILGAHTTRHRSFSEEESAFLQSIANVLASAIRRGRAENALRESENRFRALADSIPGIVWTSLPDGGCDYVNQRWHDFTGMSLEDTEAFGWLCALHEDDVERSRDRWMQSVAGGEPFEIDFRFRGKDGSYRWFLGRALPLRDEQGRIVKWFGNCMDIEQQKRMEQSLKIADHRKDEFLAMLAHELRNPLVPIRSGVDVLAVELGEKHEVVQLMRAQIEHVVRLVEDLLDVSRIVQKRIVLRKQPVEFSTLVDRAVSTVATTLKDRGHKLRLSIPQEDLWLSADPVRLLQIVENLLNNAVKYTDPGGRIELRAERCGSELWVRVTDNGIGIDRELLPHIFDLFTQSAQALDRSQGGLGIGLTLVRNLVELHGGSISVASEGPGKGSEFGVRLPLIAPPPEQCKSDVQGPSRAVPRRVLIVDDNAAAAKMLALLLARDGHQIESAYDGFTALERMTSFRPDVVLLDIGLPTMDGYAVAEKIRQAPEFDGILLVALTGYGQEEDIRRSKAAGFDEHLVKPPALPELQRLLACANAPLRDGARTSMWSVTPSKQIGCVGIG